MIKKKYKITGTVTVVIIIMAALLYAIADRGVQRWICTEGIAALEEKLGTRVSVDSIDVSLFDGKVACYGFEMDDRRKVKMLRVDTMRVQVGIVALLDHNLDIEEVTMHGATAVLYKVRKDSAANYQFVVDAFRTKNKTKARKPKTEITTDLREADFSRLDMSWDVMSERTKGGDTLDANHLRLKDMRLTLKGTMKSKDAIDMHITKLRIREEKSCMTVYMADGSYNTRDGQGIALLMNGFRMKSRSRRLGFDRIVVSQNSGRMDMKKPFSVKIDSLRYWTNNHKPRKNVGKPHRGAFDAGHLDAVLNLDAEVRHADKDSISGVLKHADAIDKGSGLVIRDLSTFFNLHHRILDLTMVKINMPRTHININKVEIMLPKKEARSSRGHGSPGSMYIVPCRVTADVCLQDLAQPFSKSLSNFSTRLNLTVDAGGPLDRISLKNIYIRTRDSRLRLTAQGEICNVTRKRQLVLHFRDIHLSARSGIKEQIVNHFAKKVNLKMQRQMKAIDDVEFAGHLDIPYRHVLIGGRLITKYGDIATDFDISSKTHYMTGTMHGTNVEIGKVMNVEKLGPVTAHAAYSFNLASKRVMKKMPDPGKLPIGHLKATIEDVSFKAMHFRNIEAEMVSDGSVAHGTVSMSMKIFDINAEFLYKQTLREQWWKVKPHLSNHRMTLKEILQKNKEKEAKAEAKAERKARKAALSQLAEKSKSLISRIKEQLSSLKKSKNSNEEEN